MQMSKHLLLLLLISSISNLEVGLDEKEAIELKIGSKLEYDKEKNYFKFLYDTPGYSYLFFYFPEVRPGMYVTDPKNERNKMNSSYRYLYTKLEYTGTYFFEIQCHSYLCELGGQFSAAVLGNYTKEIDLSQSYYRQPIDLSDQEQYFGSIRYKVSGIKQDTIIYFMNLRNYNDGYFPYDPENPDSSYPYSNNLTIFEVSDIAARKTYKNLKYFEFKTEHEYIITIHCFKTYHLSYEYNYPNYIFFSIIRSNAKTITGEGDFIMSNDIIYGGVNSNNQKDLYLLADREMDGMIIYYAKTDENINDIFNDINKFSNLTFQNNTNIQIRKKEKQSTIFFVFPYNSYYSSKIKLYIVNEIIEKYSPSYFIPANTTKMIYFEDREKMQLYGTFNYIITYKSQCKNMRISFSNDNEMTDYIIQNYLPLSIYVSKSDKDCTITISSYTPKFAFFGAENPYIFNAFYNYVINSMGFINFNNYVKLTQMNARFSSKYIPWYEFYNAYLNKLNLKLNIYIRQLYGGSELYECNADDFNERQLNPLMTPISNVKCKNKKSLFNRLWSLDGTRIISGYLTPDSYYDIYVEINNDENHVINLSPIMLETYGINNNAKYLKKDIVYKLNFELDHLIKLEPGFDAEIVITDGKQKLTINSKNPTVPVTGKSYSIKSNNDAMVYFFGRQINGYKQLAIDIEKSKGKIIKIKNCNGELKMDFGFENYSFSSFLMRTRIRDDGVVYLDNIYDKKKVELVPNEKFYIYGDKGFIDNLEIEYIDENLNNKNNDYNIFLIPANNKNNSIIINTHKLDTVITDFKFCQKDTIFNFSLTSEREKYEVINDFNAVYLKNLELFNGDNKLTFQTNKPFIFTYSFFDEIDHSFMRNEVYYNERSVFDELIIDEIYDKNNKDNIIKIKFYPNYKQSSTRYIILIAQKNNENTLDNFKDPCFIVDLLNRKPKGVLTDVIYDVGETNLIEAEVDISNIIYDKKEYIINIISQELRFDKKINFYEPKEFTHPGKKDINDGDEDEDKEGEPKNYSLALSVVTPILCIIIIGLVLFIFLLKRKGSSSKDIESLSTQLK